MMVVTIAVLLSIVCNFSNIMYITAGISHLHKNRIELLELKYRYFHSHHQLQQQNLFKTKQIRAVLVYETKLNYTK